MRQIWNKIVAWMLSIPADKRLHFVCGLIIAATSGDYSIAVVEGKESIALAGGYKSKAKGALGCWLVLAERDNKDNILGMKAVKVDGVQIKPDTFYILKEGEVVEYE